MPFQIIRNDITKVNADAIVNSANPEPIYGAGVDQAIYKAAGEKKLLAERKKIGDIAPGHIAVTPAFDLPAKYVIHAVGPIWQDGNHGELDVLKSCYEKSLKKAYALRCKSIAFPLISTGVYGYPKDKGLQVALTVLQEFAMHHRMEIFLVIYDTDSYELSGKVFDDIESYIDDNYVDENQSAYYDGIEEKMEFLREQRFRRRRNMDARKSSVANLNVFKEKTAGDRDKDIIEEDDKTFQEKLFEYLDASGMKDHEFYKSVLLSKQLFSKLRSNKYYQPSRTTAFLFCLKLKLNIEEAQDLLSRAGYALNPTNKVDMVVKACIENKQYDVFEIDLYLDKKGYPRFFKTDEDSKKEK